METLSSFVDVYFTFLIQWPEKLAYIFFATLIWVSIIWHLFVKGHAKFGIQGKSEDIACGDIRVNRLFVIFGGPAGLTFGLPYFFVMNTSVFQSIVDYLPFGVFLQKYWGGFIHLQFITSVLQTALFLYVALVGKKSPKGWRLFKSHLKGCGWISALSPIGWIPYGIQQLLPNEWKWLIWVFRDLETCLLFVANFTQIVILCLLGSLSGTIVVPSITWIDQDYDEDEDSGA